MGGQVVASPSIRCDEAFDAGVGLDYERDSPEGTRVKAGASGFGVFTCGGGHGSFAVDGLDGAVDAVVAVNAGEMPLDDLRDCVCVDTIKVVQAGDRDFHEIVIDLALALGVGVGVVLGLASALCGEWQGAEKHGEGKKSEGQPGHGCRIAPGVIGACERGLRGGFVGGR